MVHPYGFGCILTGKNEGAGAFKLTADEMVIPPVEVDHRPVMPPVYNQGQLGSCVYNAVSADVESVMIKEGLAKIFTPSRLYPYYWGRLKEGTPDQDSGSTIFDGVCAYVEHGFLPETDYPYDISTFTTAPTAAQVSEAKKGIIGDHGYVPQNEHSLEMVLAAGFNVVVGIAVYDSFMESIKSGIVPMPNPDKEQLRGGHGILVVGYNSVHKYAICRNSWGEAYGLAGYFLLPFAFLFDPRFSSDWRTIRVVTSQF